MPRNEIAAAAPVGRDLPTSSPQTILDEQARLEAQRLALADLDQRYGLTGPYDRDALLRSAQTLIVETGMRLLMLGRVFCLIKAHEPDGEWLSALDQLGVSPRMAQRCMATARRLEGKESRLMLAAQLSSSKVLELTALDDDQLDEIADGQIKGLKLDDLDRMSTKELRDKLRKLREERAKEAETQGEIIAGKDKKLNDLDRKLRYWGKSEPREKADTILSDLALAVVEANSILARIETAVRSTRAVYDEAGDAVPADIETQIAARVADLSERIGALQLLAEG